MILIFKPKLIRANAIFEFTNTLLGIRQLILNKYIDTISLLNKYLEFFNIS